MDAQELRNLQEAYIEVVMNEIDEGYKDLPVDKMIAKSKSLSRIPREPGAPRWDRNAQRASDIRKTAGTHSRAKVKKVEKANRERGTQREEYDLYDIILSHLLDEGYAETPESAEAIMVNMSEEWREEIIDEANKAERELGLSSRAREQARNLNRNADKPIFYKNSQMGKSSDSISNKAHKRMTAKRQASHKAGRHLRGDTGEKGNVVKSRYQANKDHTDGYPSITKRGEGPF